MSRLRSEEHTSELQSRRDLVCRLLLEKKNHENGDLCAWVHAGVGASADFVFSTGTFPLQTTWSHDANHGVGGCVMTHPTVHNPVNTAGPITSRLRRSTSGCVDDYGTSSDTNTAIGDIYDCNGSAAQK